MGHTGLHEDATIAVGETTTAAIAWRYGGALRVTVIAKATFAFASDAAMARTAAQPIFRDDAHHGKSPARSIQFASDLVPYLHRGEVFFTGHAYAPAGSAPEAMSVRLGVFPDGPDARPLVDKTLNLRRRGGLRKVALTYEHAYGGVGWPENPLGLGVMGDDEPTVFDPRDDKRLAGFGPIGGIWPARHKLLGQTPRKALEGRILEIPDGFQWAYFQAAPADQQIEFLRGDEWIVMDGMHPTLPRARMRLPGARGLARVYGLSPSGVAEGQPLVLHADTLHIDGDAQRCTVTFRGVFPVASEAALDAVRLVAGVELPGAPVVWPDPAGLAPIATSGPPAEAEFGEGTITLGHDDFESVDGEAFEGTMAASEEQAREAVQPSVALPFQGNISPFAQASPPRAAPREQLFSGTLVGPPDEDARAAQKSVLPFAEARGSARPPGPAAMVAPAPVGVAPLPPPLLPPPPASRSPWAASPPPSTAGLGVAPPLDAAGGVAIERTGTEAKATARASAPLGPPAVAVPTGARTFGAHFLAAMELIQGPGERA